MREEISAMSKWMSLADTAHYMCIDDPFMRMKGEALQLQIRMSALLEYMKSNDNPYLAMQYMYMKKYFDILIDRLEEMKETDAD